MDQILIDIQKYLEYIIFKVEKELKPSYYHFLVEKKDYEKFINYIEIEFTHIAERVRAGLDSLWFQLISSKIDLTKDQQREIYFPYNFNEIKSRGWINGIDKKIINEIEEFHNHVMDTDKWNIIKSLRIASNYSKHRLFQIKLKSLSLKSLIIYSEKCFLIIPSTVVATKDKKIIKFATFLGNFNINVPWLQINTNSEIKISWEIDIENDILPKIENANYLIRENALIRMDLNELPTQPNLPWSDYIFFYIDCLYSILEAAYKYFKKHPLS